MKLAVNTNNYVADLATLKAINSGVLANGQRMLAGLSTYSYYVSAVIGEKPDDLPVDQTGRWRPQNDIRDFIRVVADSYDFATNNDTEVTSIKLTVTLHNLGVIAYLDLRESAEAYTSAIGFATLSQQDKEEASKLFVTTKANRDTLYTDEQQLEHAHQHVGMLSAEVQVQRLNEYAETVRDGEVCCTSQARIVKLANYVSNDHTMINYMSGLKSGVKLHKVEAIGVDGLIGTVKYYDNYVDSNNKGQEVLKVEHVWVVDGVEPIPAAKSVESRVKTRSWVDDNAEYHANTKVSPKLYDTSKKKNDEGVRRRDNIIHLLNTNLVTILILNETSPDQDDAEGKLIAIFEQYNAGISTYGKTGKGSIYNDIGTDATAVWLDALLGATAQGYLGLDVSWATKTIREYVIDKLKGLV